MLHNLGRYIKTRAVHTEICTAPASRRGCRLMIHLQRLADEVFVREVGDGDFQSGRAVHLTQDGVVGTLVARPAAAE